MGKRLYEAAGNGDVPKAKELITSQADVTWTADDGTAALHAAALRGRDEIVQLLIDAGADMSTCFTANESWEGMSALEHAEEGMRENEGAVEFDGYHKVVMMLRELQNPSGSVEKTKPS